MGMARQGKLKCHYGSEVNAMAAKTSVKASPQSLLRKAVPIHSTWRKPHIRDRNNQRHVLLQLNTCKCVRLEREASGLHSSWNSCSILPKCIKNDIRRPEIQKFPGGMPQTPIVGALHVHLSTSHNFRIPLRISSYTREEYRDISL